MSMHLVAVNMALVESVGKEDWAGEDTLVLHVEEGKYRVIDPDKIRKILQYMEDHDDWLEV